jgi:hypothetical protein
MSRDAITTRPDPVAPSLMLSLGASACAAGSAQAGSAARHERGVPRATERDPAPLLADFLSDFLSKCHSDGRRDGTRPERKRRNKA